MKNKVARGWPGLLIVPSIRFVRERKQENHVCVVIRSN